jgi:hypothetical protein
MFPRDFTRLHLGLNLLNPDGLPVCDVEAGSEKPIDSFSWWSLASVSVASVCRKWDRQINEDPRMLTEFERVICLGEACT